MYEKKKINWLLILQAWAMLWVVIGHAFLGKHNAGPEWETMLGTIAYSFHMPLFMLVSGWLFYLTRLNISKLNREGYESVNDERQSNGWTYWAIVKDKAIRLLLPGLMFSIIAFALKIAFPDEISRQTGLSLNEIVHAYLYPYDNPFRELWFIAVLFIFFLITPLWQVLLKRKWLMWVSVAVFIAVH